MSGSWPDLRTRQEKLDSAERWRKAAYRLLIACGLSFSVPVGLGLASVPYWGASITIPAVLLVAHLVCFEKDRGIFIGPTEEEVRTAVKADRRAR